MRSIWKGSLGFGLVSIPVKLYSAVQTSSLDFDMLDGRDHARIRYQRVNEHTHKEVPYDKIVKGYKLNDDYVIVEEHDFEAAAPEKSKVIEIESFVDIADVTPMFYETSYYTEPDTKNNKAYALLIKALVQSKKAGLARFVLRSTESLCIVHPVENVLVVTRIRFAQEIRSTDDLNIADDVAVSKKELDVGLALINQYAEHFDVSKFKDEYNDELLKIIKAKSKGKTATVKKLKPQKATGDNLYEQLMQSLNTKKGHNMSLLDYFKKRDFKKTTEPKSGKASGKKLEFVVQRHHASHLHYDFRLELDGTLKSWAVPKGPSMDPHDKRLAMMVEDHPIDYRHFEGIIPNGNYGAGVVLIWDNGTYTSLAEKREDDVKTLRAGLKSGNLKFRLNGDILKGEFALVKLHNAEDNSWLLIKHNDEFAHPGFNSESLVPDKIKAMKNNKSGEATALPSVKTVKAEKKSPEVNNERPDDEEERPAKAYKPMMAKLEAKIFDNEDWIYERKLDGYRALGYTNRKAKLISRNDIDFSDNYKKIVDQLKLISKEAILDGELVIEDKNDKSSFQYIQHYDGDTKELKLKYYVFDLLNLDGHDLRGIELIKRKQLLKSLLAQSKAPDIIYNDHVAGKGIALFEKAKKEGWEGIIGKDGQSYYDSGKRTDRWLKFKLQNSQEAIICGYTAPTGGRKHFGSLILGIKPGEKIQYIGNCGTGFNDATIKELYGKLHPLETDEKPFDERITRRTKITWVKPVLVCEVWYSEWTADKHLRHPVFKGLRADKKSEQVVMETPDKQLADEEVITYGSKKLKMSHLNKVFWKEEGITKGQLIKYYRDMADWIIPYLKNKPISMRRQPNGTEDPGFFQKDTDAAHLPDFIKTEPLYSESNDKHINYIIGDDAATLLYMVNMGCIEINPWLSNYKTPENPDFVVIDLDPHDVPFSQAVEAALKTKEVFERMKLEVFIKTSGSKGLHIYCYLGAKYDYDFVKLFAEYAANLIHDELPDTTSVERSPAKRKNRVYIDFLQNRRGQTIACPYSVRPKPGATVSMPLHWDEVTDNLKLSDYTIFNTPDRVKKTDDPWKNLTKSKNDLKKALELMKK